MPRLRQVGREELTDETIAKWYTRLFGDRDPVAEPGTATGTPGDWWTVFALSPEIFHHAVSGFAMYRSPERRLDPVLRELGQARAGWVRGSQFVFSQHCKSLRDLEVSEERIAAVPTGAASPLFSEVERAVLAYADALVDQGGRVSDGLFERLRAHLDDVQIFELTYITAMYDMHAVIARALRLEYDDRPEPIVEIGGGGLRGRAE